MIQVRSLMFVPGISPRFLERAPTTGADLVCVDLEDSVAPADKGTARELVKKTLPTLVRPDLYLLFVRVNGLDTGLLEEDLLAVVGPELDGISLPKAHRPEIVRQVDHYLAILEKERGLPVGKVKIIPWIESAEAVLDAREICKSSPRLLGAALGSEDFTADMHITRSKESAELEWARFQMATACNAAGVAAFDAPFMDIRDTEFLEKEARFMRSIGYRGKFCVHPTQVEIVNRVFQPSQAEVEEARRIVQAYEEGERQGRGAVALEGRVIDRPVYVRAVALLKSVEAQPNAAKEP
ncbi:MAG: CoA ester lyase [Chloroflexi bacterium]|nr:CoA ester lyase [Chloroflexota bacterium]